jgi:hypothetical protein
MNRVARVALRVSESYKYNTATVVILGSGFIWTPLQMNSLTRNIVHVRRWVSGLALGGARHARPARLG